MRNIRWTWMGLFALVGVALAIYFEPTHCVRGWLQGEALFEGRPTSYWREVVIHEIDPAPTFIWDRVRKWVGAREEDTPVQLVRNVGADCVLKEMTHDKDERVARFAVQ